MTDRFAGEKRLRASGLRVTDQRIDILLALMRAKRPVTALELAETQAPSADTATVYRTLHVLEKNGLVRRVDLRQNGAAFEYEDPKYHHHHVICTRCERIEPITACDFESLQKSALASTSFSRITGHSIELFGVCNRCEKRIS